MDIRRSVRWLLWLLAGMVTLWIVVLVLYVVTRDSTLGQLLVVELLVILAAVVALLRLRSIARRIRR